MLGFGFVCFLVSMLTVRHGTMNSVQCYSLALQLPCNWLQRAQKLRSHNSENPALSKIIYDAFETAAGQNVAMHVSPTVRNSAFLICLPGSFNFTSFPNALQTSAGEWYER